MIKLSIIIPVYNRPEELKELLDSLTMQSYKDVMEVIVVEDGSTLSSEEAVKAFEGQLDIVYVRQENAGPAAARNHGARLAKGEVLAFFDSDCYVPSDFFENIKKWNQTKEQHYDCFGTRDSAHTFFSPMQKAISYSMTSLFTTGGIRGTKGKKMDVFYPRSYSMCVSRKVFEAVGGFSNMRYGEDLDLSMRIKEAGYAVGLVSDTFVYHKRRTSFRAFFKQTFCSGTARIELSVRHPGTLKLVHMLPSLAVVMLVVMLLLALLVGKGWLLPIGAYALLIFIDSFRQFRSISVSLLSLVASAIQIVGYGLGFFYKAWQRFVLRKTDGIAFKNTFYE